MSVLILVPVAGLPFPREGFIDCGAIGCEANAVRLNVDCDEQLYLNCLACRHLLIYDLRDGWSIRCNSREELTRRRQEAREQNTPRIGRVWKDLQKMRKVA